MLQSYEHLDYHTQHCVCLRVICPAVHGAVCVLLSTLYLSQPYLYRPGICTLLLLASYQPLLYVFVLLKNFYPTVLIVPLNALHWPAHLNLYLSLLWNQHFPALCICLPIYVLVSNSEL